MTRNKRYMTGLLAAGLALALTSTSALAQQPQQPSAKVTAKTSSLVLIPETKGTGDWVTVLCNNIKTPNDKDLFITASFEAGLYTRTETPDTSMSTARARVRVRVLLDGQQVEPGVITYNDRIQTLSTVLEPTEAVKLILRTMAANSFGYVAVDVPVGVHQVCAQARVDTEGTTTDGAVFAAMGSVGKGTLTVESVRLIKGEDVVEVP